MDFNWFLYSFGTMVRKPIPHTTRAATQGELRPVKAGARGHDDGDSGESDHDVVGSGIGDDLSSGNCPCPVVFGVRDCTVCMIVKMA